MSPFFLLSSLLFLLCPPMCSGGHIITIHTPTSIQLSSLAWDPIAEHFVAGSTTGPTVYAISDDGIVGDLISDPSDKSPNMSATSIAVDHVRHRLIVAFSNPFSIAAYDLKSHRRIFVASLPELDTIPGGVAVDVRSGEAFVSSTNRGVVWKVGLEGAVRAISESKIYRDQGLGGVVHVSRGYLLVVQPIRGKIFRVNCNDGAVEEVYSKRRSNLLGPAGHAIALHRDLSVVIATNQSLLFIKGDDSWSLATLNDKSEVEEGATIVALAMREGKRVYFLVKFQEGYRIEEATSKGWPLEDSDFDFMAEHLVLVVMAGIIYGNWILAKWMNNRMF